VATDGIGRDTIGRLQALRQRGDGNGQRGRHTRCYGGVAQRPGHS
jgi:hypothetical protein